MAISTYVRVTLYTQTHTHTSGRCVEMARAIGTSGMCVCECAKKKTTLTHRRPSHMGRVLAELMRIHGLQIKHFRMQMVYYMLVQIVMSNVAQSPANSATHKHTHTQMIDVRDDDGCDGNRWLITVGRAILSDVFTIKTPNNLHTN